VTIDRAFNLEDVRKLAKKRLPRICFDFIEGGVDDEECLVRNREAFRRYALLPRYLVDVSKRDQSVALFGRSYSSPFGISPTGVAELFRPGADTMLAEAAVEANIPFCLSTNSQPSIEKLARIAPDNLWPQIYGSHDHAITGDMVRRARDAGLQTLVLTVDVPIAPNRERNFRNGFSRPFKMRWDVMLEALTHPAWLISYYRRGGLPMMENWQPYAPAGASANDVADVFGAQTPASGQTWKVLEMIRDLWPGNLVVKGILHPDDAIRATDMGANGIVISNHGGRQLDRTPSPLEMFPAIKAAVGERSTLMIESGVRRGADIVIALCLGAKFCFFGRPTLYGVAAAGPAGARRVIEIVRKEVDLVMAQIGCAQIAGIGPEFLMPPETR
jgi:(S)-mandelate dehydrogenase